MQSNNRKNTQKELLQVLEVFCQIMIVEINQDRLCDINKFEKVSERIVKNYSQKTFSRPYGTIYVGKEALNKIIEYTYVDKFKSLSKYLVEDPFFCIYYIAEGLYTNGV